MWRGARTNLRVRGRHRAGGHGLAPSILTGAELRLLAALGRRRRAHRAAPHGGPGRPVGWITRGSGVSLNKRGTNGSRVRGARGRTSVAKGWAPSRRMRTASKSTLERRETRRASCTTGWDRRLARLETHLTALRPRADMCEARPDDAASGPARAVREVEEPAVYPDTARHVVAIAMAPPTEHEMSVGTRNRRYACAAICAERASGVASSFATRHQTRDPHPQISLEPSGREKRTPRLGLGGVARKRDETVCPYREAALFFREKM